jgi:hypothetical protein
MLPAVGLAGHRNWVRFVKTSRPALSASVLAAFEGAHLVRQPFSSMTRIFGHFENWFAGRFAPVAGMARAQHGKGNLIDFNN